jgi:hypothetical protein
MVPVADSFLGWWNIKPLGMMLSQVFAVCVARSAQVPRRRKGAERWRYCCNGAANAVVVSVRVDE